METSPWRSLLGETTTLARRPPLVSDVELLGVAWILSSSVATTYSTTAFLKYRQGNSVQYGKLQNNRQESKRASQSIEATFSKAVGRNKAHLPKKSRGSNERLSMECISPSAVVNGMDRPQMLTFFRFLGSFVLGLLCHLDFWRIIARFQDTFSAIPNFAIPALFLFAANYSNSIALNRIGVPLTYTAKCGIPLVTVLFTMLAEGRNAMPSVPTLVSLIVIACGIAAASWNAPIFEISGFVAAIFSTTAQAALVVTGKKAVMKTALSGPAAQHVMAAVALAISLTIYVGKLIIKRDEISDDYIGIPPIWLCGMAVAAYHIEYCLSFMLVRRVSTVTFGTCDSARRLAIILAGKKMFGGPKFSTLNKVGVCLALSGALLYSVTNVAER